MTAQRSGGSPSACPRRRSAPNLASQRRWPAGGRHSRADRRRSGDRPAALSGLLDIVGGYEVVGLAASGEEGIELTSRPPRTWCSWTCGSRGWTAWPRPARSGLAPDAPEVIMISTDVEGLPADQVRAAGALAARAKADLDPDWLEELRNRLSPARPLRPIDEGQSEGRADRGSSPRCRPRPRSAPGH